MPVTGASLSLSTADRALLLATQQAFLSPLDAESPLTWYRRASRPLKELLGADACALYLPHAESPWALSEDFSMAELTAFPARLEPLLQLLPVHARSHALGAYARDEVFRDCLAEYYGSAYYNDYIVPVRALDGLGLSVAKDAEHVAPSHGTTAHFYFYHQQLRGRRFSKRELGLLQLVYPAFTAGVRMWWQLSARRADLAHAFGALGDAVVVSDLYGAVLHRSAAADKLLAGGPDSERLQAAVVAAIRSVNLNRASGSVEGGTLPGTSMRPVVRTTDGTFCVDATFVNSFAGTVEPRNSYILVRLHRMTAKRLIASELSDQFGLTPAQARVTQSMMDGRSNAEIAATLNVSAHTVRHHVGAVLRKCGVHSRSELRVVLDAQIR